MKVIEEAGTFFKLERELVLVLYYCYQKRPSTFKLTKSMFI